MQVITGPFPTCEAALRLALPYVLQLALLIIAVLGVTVMREPLRQRVQSGWRIQRPEVPDRNRIPFAAASAAAFVGWAVASLFLSVLPSYAQSFWHLRNLALLGGLSALMLVASLLVQLALQRLAYRPAMAYGSALLIPGLAGLVLAPPLGSTVLLLAASVLAGAGNGLTFMGGTRLINAIAPRDRRANVLSTYYAIMYLGIGVPVLGVGYGAAPLGLYGAVAVFAAVMATLCLGTLVTLRPATWSVAEKEQQRAPAA